MFFLKFCWFKVSKKDDGSVEVDIIDVVVFCGDVVFLLLIVVYDGIIFFLSVEEKCIVYKVLFIL